MKTKQIFSHALLLVAGLLIGTFFISKNYFLPPPFKKINVSEAKRFIIKYKAETKYVDSIDKKSGYFDISKETLNNMIMAMDNINTARVYYGEDSNINPKITYFLVNEIDENGIELKSKEIILLPVNILGNQECPKYCDLNNTYLGK